ncbi:MAG: hypothetical protein NWE96_11375 [Candidatus Bathyarchaeota archaeon]|nr:hypothetical protein [Candidatus Bathyarchaeota archaeon]
MRHNISITMDQKLFRQLETIRGREKRSTFIEHLIVLGLQDYANKKEKKNGDNLFPAYIADFKPKSA